MAKKLVNSNHRVVVYPRNKGDLGFCKISGEHWTAAETRRICEGIASEILKHVGKSDRDRGDVVIDWDTRAVCEFCGSDWEADDNQCCTKATDEYDAAKAAADTRTFDQWTADHLKPITEGGAK